MVRTAFGTLFLYPQPKNAANEEHDRSYQERRDAHVEDDLDASKEQGNDPWNYQDPQYQNCALNISPSLFNTL